LEEVAADADGNIAITGAFRASMDCGGAPLANTGTADMFVAPFSP